MTFGVFEQPLDFAFPATGVVLWLVGAVVLAVVASIAPAMNAARLEMRDALAYE